MKKLLLLLALFACVNVVSSQSVSSVGLIGEASPFANWDDEVPMVQDAVDTSMWTLNVVLSDGPVKFRANNDWAINWGNTNPADFMHGIAIQDEGNMNAFAGEYNVSFNHVTGEFRFEYVSDIGMIGEATPLASWDDDVNMYRDQNDPNKFFTGINLTAGPVKWRKDDAWVTDWGNNNSDFPAGVAAIAEGNINVPTAGFYVVTLDTLTGDYLFSGETVYDTISLIGEGIAGDWETDFILDQASNPHIWTTSITLAGGGVKFRAEKDWATNWGGTAWPVGDAVLGSNDNIPSEAGDYNVYFNSKEQQYRFWAADAISTVGIIGTATPNGWNDPDTDMEQDADNPNVWKLRLDLVAGECKFRINDGWDNSYGAADWPTGFGELNGTTNITVPEDGDYIVTFNALSGEYSFNPVVEYGTIGIIGKSSPNADWETDTPMNKDEDDFNLWTIDEITFTDSVDPCTDDTGVKFRAENDWGVNWGNCNDFPSGVGVANDPNIAVTAGTYSVVFRSDTGEYTFADPISNTEELLDPSSITLYPNPTNATLNVDLSSTDLSGLITLSILDMTGKEVLRVRKDKNAINTLDVSQLAEGNYLLNLSNDSYFIGKRFSIVK